MSYLVLARKWRPQKFSELVGQPHVAKTLTNGLQQGRVAHAYLFSGPRGVGKTTTARLVARALNCVDLQAGEPCGVCEPCKGIASGNFIDFIEIDAASNRGIDDIRQLRDGIRYAPIEGKAKVYIIDEVHMLTSEAFNALLKTLEEPPPHAYFCLATTEIQKLPATIISRCQRFDFRRVSSAELRDHIRNICDKDDMKYEEEALDIIARRADGSVRDSLSLLDQVIAYAGGIINKSETEEVIGEVKLDQYFKAVKLISSKSIADAFHLDQELAASGADPQDYLLGLERYLIQLLQARTLGIENVDIPLDAQDDFKSAIDLLSDADIIRLLQLVTTAETDVRRNFNPRVRLQLLLLKFASFDRSVILSEIIDKIKDTPAAPQVKKKLNPVKQTESPVNTPSPNVESSVSEAEPIDNTVQSSTTPQKTEITAESGHQVSATEDSQTGDLLENARNNWKVICDGMSKKYNASAKMIYHGGYPSKVENGQLVIHFSSPTLLDAARRLLQELRKEFESVMGTVVLNLQIGKLPDRDGQNDSESTDPGVQLLVDRLGARPVN